MLQSPEPPAVVETAPVEAPAQRVLVARSEENAVVAASDLPLQLRKAARSEEALLRRALFITAKLEVTRPADGQGGDSYTWAYAGYLQRQLCFTSMTGAFACTVAEIMPLAAKAEGEAPLPPGASLDDPGSLPAAQAARERLSDELAARAGDVFDADRRTKVDPQLRAAGVVAAAR